MLDKKSDPTADEIAKFEAGDSIATVYEKLSEWADEVADSRFDSAEKVLKHKILQENVQVGEQALTDSQAKLDKAKANLDTAMAKWVGLWESLRIQSEAPEVMQESLQSVEAIREAVAAREEIVAERDAAIKAKENLRQQLLALATRLGIETSAEADAVMLTAIEKRIQKSLDDVRSQARREAEESLHLKVLEKEALITSMQRKIDDLKRKAEQGSQQLQEEVQELNLEATLHAAFPTDRDCPVAKGETGGDLLHHIMGPAGKISGTILWESKRT